MFIYVVVLFLFFKQKTAYEMRISDWSSDVCSSDLGHEEDVPEPRLVQRVELPHDGRADADVHAAVRDRPYRRLECARDRAARRRQDHPPERELHRPGRPRLRADQDRQSIVEGKSVSGRVNLGGRRSIKKKKK